MMMNEEKLFQICDEVRGIFKKHSLSRSEILYVLETLRNFTLANIILHIIKDLMEKESAV